MTKTKMKPVQTLTEPTGEVGGTRLVKVRSLRSWRVIITPNEVPSGSRYVFEANGVCDSVAQQDLPTLLAIVSRGGGCCGHSVPGGQPYFKLEE